VVEFKTVNVQYSCEKNSAGQISKTGGGALRPGFNSRHSRFSFCDFLFYIIDKFLKNVFLFLRNYLFPEPKPRHWPELMNFLPVEVLYHISLFLDQNTTKLLKINKQFNEVISSFNSQNSCQITNLFGKLFLKEK
jgi:hypothetical protein